MRLRERWIRDSKLVVGLNATLGICAGVPRLSPKGSWDRLQPPAARGGKQLKMDGWMDGLIECTVLATPGAQFSTFICTTDRICEKVPTAILQVIVVEWICG